MVIRGNGEIETDDESDTDSMPPLEDVDDEEYAVQGELLVSRRLQACKQKKLKKCSGRTSFILGAMSKTRYVV